MNILYMAMMPDMCHLICHHQSDIIIIAIDFEV